MDFNYILKPITSAKLMEWYVHIQMYLHMFLFRNVLKSTSVLNIYDSVTDNANWSSSVSFYSNYLEDKQ